MLWVFLKVVTILELNITDFTKKKQKEMFIYSRINELIYGESERNSTKTQKM